MCRCQMQIESILFFIMWSAAVNVHTGFVWIRDSFLRWTGKHHQKPICTFSCTSVFILIFINPQYTVLHILLLILFYYLFLFSFSAIFIYIFSCLMLHCFYFFIYFFHFPLSGTVLTYISLLIIPCMIVYVTNNKEPWTLKLWTISI